MVSLFMKEVSCVACCLDFMLSLKPLSTGSPFHEYYIVFIRMEWGWGGGFFINEPEQEIQHCGYASQEDSDQPRHQFSMIMIRVHMNKAFILNYTVSAA